MIRKSGRETRRKQCKNVMNRESLDREQKIVENLTGKTKIILGNCGSEYGR